MIQELVLVLDGCNGLGLAFFLFGASVFWVPAGHPKRVPKRQLRQPVEAAVKYFLPPKRGGSGHENRAERPAKKLGRNRPGSEDWGVDLHALEGPVGTPGNARDRQTGFTG